MQQRFSRLPRLPCSTSRMALCSHHVLPLTASCNPHRFPSTSSRRSLLPSPLTFQCLVFEPISCSVQPRQQVSAINSVFTAEGSMSVVATKKNTGNAQVFDSEEELSVSLAKYVADLSNKFTKERNAFTVVLSGGSLIKSLRKLVEPPYLESIDWSRWHVFWADERVVPKNHPDSNYLLAFEGFLSKVPIPAGNVYAINDALSAEGAVDDYETCLKHLVTNKTIELSEVSGFPKFDLMLLGMGPDGHIASLFPGHPLVQESKKWVTFIKDSPKPPPERITFTFPVINSSAHIALVVAGSGKADVVAATLGAGQESSTLPVQLVSPEGELKWFLDKGAASKL